MSENSESSSDPEMDIESSEAPEIKKQKRKPRKPLTDEQKEALRERCGKARQVRIDKANERKKASMELAKTQAEITSEKFKTRIERKIRSELFTEQLKNEVDQLKIELEKIKKRKTSTAPKEPTKKVVVVHPPPSSPTPSSRPLSPLPKSEAQIFANESYYARQQALLRMVT